MDWEKFILHTRGKGLIFSAGGQYEFRRGDMLLVPLRTPKDPRNLYELLKLIGAYAYPTKRAVSARQLTERMTKRADIADPKVSLLTWHHPWRLPEDFNPDTYISFGAYMKNNGYTEPSGDTP